MNRVLALTIGLVAACSPAPHGAGPTEVELDGSPRAPAPLVPKRRAIRSIGLGFEHSCVAFDDTTVSCWGSNSSHAVAPGKEQYLRPVPIEGLSGAVELAANASATCARLWNGKLTCWGGGILDPRDGNTAQRPVPVRDAEGLRSVS